MQSDVRRHVIWAVSVASLLAVLGAPAAAGAGAPELELSACRVERLPLPLPARESVVTAGDPRGRWLGGYRLDGPDGEALTEALLWRNGQLVGFDPDLSPAGIDGINRHGVVVGSGYDASGQSVPFAYVDGATVLLAEPAGTSFTRVTGVSADGTVVGYAGRADGSTYAITWSLDQPDVVTPIAVPTGAQSSRAEGISGNGTIAVGVRTSDRSRVFVVDRSGKRTEVHGVVDGSSLEARSIANGWMSAYERNGVGAEEAYFVRLDLRNDTVERVPIGGVVNAHGTVSGQVGEDAALYDDALRPLPSLRGVPNGADVHVLDRHGQPAGQAGASAADASVAVRWRCG